MTTKTTGTIKGFIFDLDGVIVFTDKLHYQAWTRMADRLGISFDETGIRAAKAGGMFAVAVHSAAGCPLADESLKTFEELLNIG